MLKIAVLISGGGSNLQSIIDAIENKEISCSIECVISDREAFGIERARKHGIETYLLDRKIYRDTLSDEILKIVDERVDLIVLAGYLSILKGDILKRFKNRIINIHPSLIPSFCGPNMYGIKVHEAAIEYGVKVSGCTVHFVDEGTDTGPIILQRTVGVYPNDDAKTLQQRILTQEHKAIVDAIDLISKGLVKIEGRRVIIY
ncbi:formyltetrahydrofolate-dependent phosphoribosylglycinamide formyltransferase [Caloramator quimbayensis]|uniref:Phosphoribosylglycinamide formyltransferase n=1 Tax=Caloramator quimbayensis TaxID=1147123 RepID=A0A1T4XRK3_9CLOT|nr:phosphoribosylglycinamide formyltransferase [Caloramator quimbayensis]SKA91705.1 formyltetrahydrofolate-dependent phosphoribosylglycinamide formyltransferase [Caloramator quimbayensis]